ncbi:MAG TPA: DUF1326 domain-containing protein [Dehalococcoidia bacterium]|nr:DUF1326 domain-containing protein [Dehalococcoidia bacterium]
MPELTPWRVSGSYFEACNCEAVCPCRRVGGSMGRPGGRSTFGICEFALSWRIIDGRAGAVDLSGLMAVIAGRYDDDEPGSPWRVALYIDQRGSAEQRHALAELFLGRLGGSVFRNFASAIGEVLAVRPARIELHHAPGDQRIDAGAYVTVRASEVVAADGPVSCGIPGHDRPGHEMRASSLRVDDGPLRWDVSERCAFSSDFDYRSDDWRAPQR